MAGSAEGPRRQVKFEACRGKPLTSPGCTGQRAAQAWLHLAKASPASAFAVMTCTAEITNAFTECTSHSQYWQLTAVDGSQVQMAPDCIGDEVTAMVDQLQSGQVTTQQAAAVHL